MALASRERATRLSPPLPWRNGEPKQRAALQTDTFNGRDRIRSACACQPVDRPPVWLMRQAGRALPEYRELKEKYSFLQLVQTPDLAVEVTLQPIRRFGFDAAILFSDILVVCEALGQAYRFREQGGIEMDFAVGSAAEVDRLQEDGAIERLEYVAAALRRLRRELGETTALLGFAGSPWTLAGFMTEGGSARDFNRGKEMFYTDRTLFNRLMARLTRTVTDYLRLQVDAGVDAVQIFDSLGGTIAAADYDAASGRWIREIIAGLEGRVPVILFAKGVNSLWPLLAASGARVVGVDWTVSLAELRRQLPEAIAIQGNLDPFLLTTTPQAVAEAARETLESLRGRPGHIFNLGHGLPPGARLECIQALVDTVRSFK